MSCFSCSNGFLNLLLFGLARFESTDMRHVACESSCVPAERAETLPLI